MAIGKRRVNEKRRAVSLNHYFIRFLLSVILCSFIGVFIWIRLLLGLTNSGVIIPANKVEQSVKEWRETLTAESVIDAKELPKYVQYAIFAMDGVCTDTNMSGKELETAKELKVSDQERFSEDLAKKIYDKIETNSQIVVVSYRIKASFVKPGNDLFEIDAETVVVISLFVLVLIGFLIPVLIFAGKLKKKVFLMKDTAELIRNHELDFEAPNTGMKELDQVMDSLIELRDSLKESLSEQWRMQQQKKEQMSALAHDIKTPLTILKGNAELLEESELDEEQKEYVGFIRKNEEQIGTYVTRILEISKDDIMTYEQNNHAKGNECAQGNICTISDFLEEHGAEYEQLCDHKQISILYDVACNARELSVREEMFGRICQNLIDNAIQYSPKQGRIQLHVTKEERSVEGICLEVMDEGPGFSKEDLIYATDAFYRADESRGSREHFGLGLAIVAKLVEEAQGEMKIQNRKKQGAIVSIWLPSEKE